MTGVVLHDSMPVRAVPWVPSGRAGSVFGSRVTCPTSSASPPARDRGSDACRLTGLVPVPSTPSSWPARIYLGALDQQLLGSGGTDLHVLYSVRDVGAYPLMSRRDILPHDPRRVRAMRLALLAPLVLVPGLRPVASIPITSDTPSAMQISLCTVHARGVSSEERPDRVVLEAHLRRGSPRTPVALLQMCFHQVRQQAADRSCRLRLHLRVSLGLQPCCRRSALPQPCAD